MVKVFKHKIKGSLCSTFILGGTSSDICLEIKFYDNALVELLNLISKLISGDVPPQLIVLMMGFPILMRF